MTRSRSVLVVEDEPPILLDIVEVLSDAGYAVVPASSVQQALSRLELSSIDVVTLDADLRGVSAAPVASRLDSLEIPYVICLSYAPNQLGRWAKPRHYVSKPVDFDCLISSIEQAAEAADRKQSVPAS